MDNLKTTKIFGFFAVFVFALFLYSVPSHAGFIISDDATGGDCESKGSWDAATKTCTLSSTVTMGVTIADNNITLDCNGKSITGGGAFQNGVAISGKKGVVVKRCNIDGWLTGIVVNNRSSNILLFKNTITNTTTGIVLLGSLTNSNIIDNVVESSVSGNGFSLTGSRGLIIL